MTMDKCRIWFMHILMVQRTNYLPTLFGYGAPTNGIIINWRLPWDFHELCVRPYLWNQIFHYIVKQDKFDDGKTTLSNVVHIKPLTRQPIIAILTKKMKLCKRWGRRFERHAYYKISQQNQGSWGQHINPTTFFHAKSRCYVKLLSKQCKILCLK